MIHDAELFTVAPDEVVVTFRTDDDREVEARVGDRSVVTGGRYHSARVTGLEPSTRYRLALDGAEPSPSASPEEFAALIRAELIKWAKVVKDAGIQAE